MAENTRLLAGKSALVTGSTSGIGEGIARVLAGAGCSVLLHGFGEAAQIETLRAGLAAEHGVSVRHHGADLSRLAEVADLMAFTAAEFGGGVDILVNNAGIQFVSPIHQFPDEKWDAILAVNLTAAFHATKAALPTMRARGWGRILNVASAHGLAASVNKSAYVAAKHGLIGLTKVTALETAREQITCNALCPGYVLTPLVDKQIADQIRTTGFSREHVINDVFLAKQPTKRFVTVEEVAALALFLCSPASASITGAALPIDGGWMAE